jgi:pyruvate dehydrogenase E2 component (dihydrolipoamide acetyltransferase)
MNRNVMIGGVAAVVVLLGTAGYLIFAGRDQAPSGGEAAPVVEGPVSANAVTVVTDYTTNLSQDGKRLTLGFPAMEVAARAGKTASTVFSATWNIKVPADERVVVATATLNGFMKSAGAPPAPKPAPEPAPAETAAPAEPAAPPADGAAAPAAAPEGEAPAATPPAAPAPAATPAPPAGPVAGDGVARIVVTVGGESAVSEWHDLAGTGQERKLSRAVSYIARDKDMRSGGRIPVTVAVEVVGGTAEETLVRLKGIDLQLFTENAPLAAPAAPEAAPAPAAAEGAVTPAEPATAEPAPAPAAGGTTP